MTKSNLTRIIDRLGFVRAQLAELELEERLLKSHLVELGSGTYNGELYQAIVAKTVREQLDLEAARAKLGAKFVLAHTNKVPVTSVRVVRRENNDA